MSIIAELPEEVRTKIAAGEVIERPAYIVKELVENALDAGARSITIKAYDGGTTKVIVSDDGIGMDREDLELCYKRHTTSKIRALEDLSKVQSMGFRGEALSSISTVSILTIRSRTLKEPVGHELLVQNGEKIHLIKKGMPKGTHIIVEHIFSSVPARQKFLRSPQAEYRLLVELILRYVLAFPEVEFDFYHDGKRIFLYKKSAFEERIQNIVGKDTVHYLLPIKNESDYVTIEGYISKPQLSYSSTRNQFLFINKRYIHDSVISSTIKNVYGTLLEPVRYPHIVLFLTIPQHLIDVNVHPRKEKVHFANMNMVIEELQQVIKEVLSKADLHYYDKRWSGGEISEDKLWQIRDGGTETYAASVLKKKVIQKNSLLQEISADLLTQFHNVYIVTETKKGLLFIDQHAAHERVLYEKLSDSLKSEAQNANIYMLNKEVQITLSPHESAFFDDYRVLIESLGFRYTLEKSVLTMQAVPDLWKDRNIKVLVREMLDDLFEKEDISTLDSFSKKMLAYLACRGAVKAGDRLTEEQKRELLAQLKKTKNPYTCPHGRPVQVEIDLKYINTLFKRN